MKPTPAHCMGPQSKKKKKERRRTLPTLSSFPKLSHRGGLHRRNICCVPIFRAVGRVVISRSPLRPPLSSSLQPLTFHNIYCHVVK